MKSITLILFIFFVFIGANGAIKTWDGGGANSNLSTPANWDNDIAPIAGDDLVFPANALAVTTINNDFTSALPFRSITFNGGTYTIDNNILGVTNGIIVNGGEHIINSTVSLSGFNQTFTHQPDANFVGEITYAQILMGSNNLTINGTAASNISNISGS
jgi:fibronectin-binding autotransporter adhesin